MSDNYHISELAARCLPYRITNRPKGNYEDFLTSVFGCPASEVLAYFYFEEQMSIADIRAWLIENIGWCVCERRLHEIMKRTGVSFRDYAERKRLSWKQGKLDGVIAKLRQHGSQVFFISSTTENMVRYLLQVSLSVLNLPWHLVIGDHLQQIIPRYEVDIPVVAVDPLTGLSCRFAVEVDTTFAHGRVKVQARDRAKDEALRSCGWRVYRVNGDSTRPVHIVPQVVDVAVDIKRVCQEALSAENGNGRTNCHITGLVPPSSAL